MPPVPLRSSDAWSLLLAPALAGRTAAALAEIGRPRPPGPWLVVAARALWALDRPGPAAAMLAQAPPGAERDALETVAHPHPGPALVRRLHAPAPQERADAACDLAWRALREGKRRHGREAIAIALAACPHHAEARRWDRFLGETRDPVSAIRRAARGGSPTSRTEREAHALSPHARSGWMSPERWFRRVESGAWSRPAPSGTALARLQRDGVVTRVLGTGRDYARLPAPHRLVDCERALDAALALEREGRDPTPAAEELWALAPRVDAAAIADAAAALVALAVRAPSAARIGLAAAELLCSLQPGTATWRSYRARLLAFVGRQDEARSGARAVGYLVRQAPHRLDAVALGLALATLRATGAGAEAERVTTAAAGIPHLAGIAQRTREAPDAPLVPILSDRTRPRGARTDHRRAG